MLCSYVIKLKLCMIVDYGRYIMNIPLFLSLSLFFFFLLHMFKGNNWHVSLIDKKQQQKMSVLPFSQTLVLARSLNGYNLAWGLHFHCGFDDLDCFRVTGVSEIESCFLDCLNDTFKKKSLSTIWSFDQFYFTIKKGLFFFFFNATFREVSWEDLYQC